VPEPRPPRPAQLSSSPTLTAIEAIVAVGADPRVAAALTEVVKAQRHFISKPRFWRAVLDGLGAIGDVRQAAALHAAIPDRGYIPPAERPRRRSVRAGALTHCPARARRGKTLDSMRHLAVLVLSGVLAGCNGGGGDLPDGGAVDADSDGIDADAAIDARSDADEYCHYDCFGAQTCADGVVTSWAHTPVPCEKWDEECPHFESYVCERGCWTDMIETGDPEVDPGALCEENRPKQVGDPCVDDSYCLPEVATVVDGTVVNVYLQCDLELGECVAREAPVVADWLSQCGLLSEDVGDWGVVETEACASGLCLYIDGEACLRQGCTAACTGDGECPPGSVCEHYGYSGPTVCKPGLPQQHADGLSCPE
jgi:hypothetical protein